MKPTHLACLLLICGAVGGAALADGGFFFIEGEAVDLSQTRQEVLMAFYNDAVQGLPHVTYVLQTRYAGTPDELAWVIPVPATPTDVVAHADGKLFDRLNEETKPRFMLVRPTRPGLIPGCGCALADSGAGGQESELVEVEAQGQAGIFDYFALSSTGANALLAWLNDNGFALPAAAAGILDGYIQQEMHFLALRVNEPSAVQTSDGEIEIPPIQFTCQSARRFYPMAISQISAADETEVVIYVLAEHRAAAANVANAVIDPNAVAYDPTSLSGTNYESLFAQTIADLGGAALITEFVNSAEYCISAAIWPDAPTEALDLALLTRLRTLIAREQMTLDFEFQDAPTDDDLTSFFSVDLPGYANAAVVAGQPLAALLVLGLFRRVLSRRARHRARARHSGGSAG
jgi:hypothetical protein